jgi:hypothetical protein
VLDEFASWFEVQSQSFALERQGGEGGKHNSTLFLAGDEALIELLGGTHSSQHLCHASEIQTEWSPRSGRSFER